MLRVGATQLLANILMPKDSELEPKFEPMQKVLKLLLSVRHLTRKVSLIVLVVNIHMLRVKKLRRAEMVHTLRDNLLLQVEVIPMLKVLELTLVHHIPIPKVDLPQLLQIIAMLKVI